MTAKAVISLTTGLEDSEKVTVAFLVAVGAAESGRPTLMFLTKEAVRLALDGVAVGIACEGCPPLPDLMKRYEAAGGRYYVCPICFDAKKLDRGNLIPGPRCRAPSRCGSGLATRAQPPSATERRAARRRGIGHSPLPGCHAGNVDCVQTQVRSRLLETWRQGRCLARTRSRCSSGCSSRGCPPGLVGVALFRSADRRIP